ncbi:electron transfer flavoprotein subunit beta/FixA family protein [Aeromicrobium yanjiei]|uniref:Electron transfer flavoprotein subunit beta/FixA family protein n=1 Tax=Aeromicrobium yanjiei TaxID=2662028 RepID=A0A5Q2MP56_9ACTN|nr:electron transfer flavoprotein subunit beta/FixA family protein [Aeromicrobium yanjiei]QGG42315.1 electron transfer flavoprotein subunit beta/FixA family protein [Aeromicrobium yanjiei]
MTDVLVCIKRVPETSTQVLLSDDRMSVDARHVGHTISPHEEAAIEIAVQVAEASGGTATVLTLGPADAVEQLRDAIALGCTRAVHIEADSEAFGPADVAAAVAELVRGEDFGLVLVGNDAADSGDFQVGVRLAYALGRPVVTGISTLTIDGERLTARGSGPDGDEIYELPCPAVIAIQEGGVAPRYPSIVGRMKAKKLPIETISTSVSPTSQRLGLTSPPEKPSTVEVLGEGPEAAKAVVDMLVGIGVVSS